MAVLNNLRGVIWRDITIQIPIRILPWSYTTTCVVNLIVVGVKSYSSGISIVRSWWKVAVNNVSIIVIVIIIIIIILFFFYFRYNAYCSSVMSSSKIILSYQGKKSSSLPLLSPALFYLVVLLIKSILSLVFSVLWLVFWFVNVTVWASATATLAISIL